MDVQLPGMVYASVQRAPVFRARVKSFNADAVRKLPGVRDVFVLDGQMVDAGEVITGVVVVADSTWAAFSARRQLQIDWDTAGASTDSWAEMEKRAQALAGTRGGGGAEARGGVGARFARAEEPGRGLY